MKRYVLLAGLMCVGLAGAGAQDSLTALAEKQQWEERFRTLNTRIEKLEEAIQSHQQRLIALATEIYNLREELARANTSAANPATQKSLELLADAIKEVDRKRMADNEKVLKSLAELHKGLVNRPVPTPRSSAGGGTSAAKTADRENGWEYSVEAGDNSAIIAAKLKKNGINVTPQQIVDANPGVAWTKLQVGQKLFIPKP